MVARGERAKRAQHLVDVRRKSGALEGRQKRWEGFRRPSRAPFPFASVPGVALRSTPGYHPTPLPGLKQEQRITRSHSNPLRYKHAESIPHATPM
jgi:hypothetical protein